MKLGNSIRNSYKITVSSSSLSLANNEAFLVLMKGMEFESIWFE